LDDDEDGMFDLGIKISGLPSSINCERRI